MRSVAEIEQQVEAALDYELAHLNMDLANPYVYEGDSVLDMHSVVLLMAEHANELKSPTLRDKIRRWKLSKWMKTLMEAVGFRSDAYFEGHPDFKDHPSVPVDVPVSGEGTSQIAPASDMSDLPQDSPHLVALEEAGASYRDGSPPSGGGPPGGFGPPPSTPSTGGGGPPQSPPAWLTPVEQEAWVRARTRAGELARGLGNYIKQRTMEHVREVWAGDTISVDVDPQARQAMVILIREKTVDAIESGKMADQLARDLANASGDFSRNWRRIANTELQGAFNEGSVVDAVRREGPGVGIARIPDQDACDDCRRLFLDATGKPRVFTATELANNNTNAGKKRVDWLPTIWPVHPNCRCDTQEVPAGFVFDSDWLLVPEGGPDA